MRKTLPFKQPLAYGFHYYAYPLGILAAHPEADPWVLSNYIQVEASTSAALPFTFFTFDYSSSPWLETLRLNREMCSLHDRGITGIVRDAISLDFYIYVTLNERYIPGRLAYQRDMDYAHDVLIHGVDDDEDVFEVFGYDDRQVFRSTRLPQGDLPAAYHNTGPNPFYDVPLTMYRFDGSGQYTFDLTCVAEGVREYLDSADSSARFHALRDPVKRAYGMDTYPVLESLLDDYVSGAAEFDIRYLQVFWEHKRLMVARLARCAETIPAVEDLLTSYRHAERLAWTLRTTMIAHRAGHNRRGFRSEASSILGTIRGIEEPALRQFVAHLDDGGYRVR